MLINVKKIQIFMIFYLKIIIFASQNMNLKN